MPAISPAIAPGISPTPAPNAPPTICPPSVPTPANADLPILPLCSYSINAAVIAPNPGIAFEAILAPVAAAASIAPFPIILAPMDSIVLAAALAPAASAAPVTDAPRFLFPDNNVFALSNTPFKSPLIAEVMPDTPAINLPPIMLSTIGPAFSAIDSRLPFIPPVFTVDFGIFNSGVVLLGERRSTLNPPLVAPPLLFFRSFRSTLNPPPPGGLPPPGPLCPVPGLKSPGSGALGPGGFVPLNRSLSSLYPLAAPPIITTASAIGPKY